MSQIYTPQFSVDLYISQVFFSWQNHVRVIRYVSAVKFTFDSVAKKCAYYKSRVSSGPVLRSLLLLGAFAGLIVAFSSV